MAGEVVIGLDLGTTSVKALALDPEGGVYGVAQHDAKARRHPSGRVEQDPHLVYGAATSCIRDVAAQASTDGLTVIAIATSAAMHSLMAVDGEGNALTGAVTWGDLRATEQARTLRKDHDWLGIYKRTGVPVHPMTPLPKLMWFRDREPELFERAARWVSMKEYLQFRLCGEWFIDYSTASTSGLLALGSLSWDAELLGLLGLDPSAFSTPVPSAHQASAISPDVAFDLGVTDRCRLVAGASDGVLANIGVGALTDEQVACSIGTSGAVRVFSSEPLLDPDGRLFCYPFDESHYLVGGPINNGGVALQWVRDHFFPELLEAELGGGRDAYSALDQLAGSTPAGANGLIFLPYLLGERAPYWDPEARGVMFGLTLTHGRRHIVRATLEGVIYQMNLVLKLMEGLIGEVSEVRVTGGFARSATWCQIMADVCNRRVLVPVSEHGSAIGAAVIALNAAGAASSWSVVDVAHGPHFDPNPENADVYAATSSRFARLYHALSPEFESAAVERESAQKEDGG